MKKLTFVITTLFTFTLFVISFTPILADDDGDSGGEKTKKIEIKIKDETDKFKFKAKDKKFEIKGLVADVPTSTSVTVGPGDQLITLDPTLIDDYHQKGTPEIGGKAKIKGVISEGDFLAQKAHFSSKHPDENEDEHYEDDEDKEHDSEDGVESLKIEGDQFEIQAPVASASSEGLVVFDQNIVLDPSLVDKFKVDIKGDPMATASAEIEGTIASDSSFLASKVKVRPAPLSAVGVKIMEVIDTIFLALKSFFAGP